MSREFEIKRDVEFQATAEEVFDAVSTGRGMTSWLFPVGDLEPRVGGDGPHGSKVLAWDPPHHVKSRSGDDSWYNQLEHVIEDQGDGTVVLRYVHSGVFVDDWQNQYDGADTHTTFYLHTLQQYVHNFAGRYATYVTADGPRASSEIGSLRRVLRELRVAEDASVGDAIQIDIPGVPSIEGEIDYLNEHFLGIITADTMYRVFGREAFGAPLSVGHHLFADDADADAQSAAWASWLDGVFARERA